MNWTEGRIKAFIVSVLRAGARKWPPKYETLADAYIGKKVNPKTNREGKHYVCIACNGEFPAKDVQVDHIVPVVDPVTGFTTWDDFISRLFCDKDNLQVLCTECHKIKSKEERYGNNPRSNSRRTTKTGK